MPSGYVGGSVQGPNPSGVISLLYGRDWSKLTPALASAVLPGAKTYGSKTVSVHHLEDILLANLTLGSPTKPQVQPTIKGAACHITGHSLAKSIRRRHRHCNEPTENGKPHAASSGWLRKLTACHAIVTLHEAALA